MLLCVSTLLVLLVYGKMADNKEKMLKYKFLKQM